MKHDLESSKCDYAFGWKDHHVRWSDELGGFVRFTWDRNRRPYGIGREELIR